MLTSRVRLAAVGGLVLGLTTVLGACGSTGQNTTAATITIAPQSYQSKAAPAPEAEAATPGTADEEGRTNQPQTYVVQAGDYPSTVAEKFDISLTELLNFNEWELNSNNIAPDFPGPGGTVEIPAGAKFIDPNAADSSDEADDEEESDTEVQTGGTTSDGAIIESPPTSLADDAADDRCVPGKYELEDGDYPGAVANKFDVSVEDMAAANRSTPNYSSFIVGTEIIIPAADDC